MSDEQVKPKRGRPPLPLWDRLVSKIEIEGHPQLALAIPELVGTPPTDWDAPFHECWNWTGARFSDKPRHFHLPDHNNIPTLRQTRQTPYAQIRIDGKLERVQRVLYDLLIEPIPKGEQLRNRNGNWWDVNPAHWATRKLHEPGEYPFKREDFEDPLGDVPLAPPPISNELTDQELVDLAEAIEHEYIFRPILTYEDFLKRFDVMIDGLPESEIKRLLKQAGLLHRLLPEDPAPL